MALIQGEQFGRLLLQNIWKIIAAFGVGVVGVVGVGLFLSHVHGIPQSKPSVIQTSHPLQKSDVAGGTERSKPALPEASGDGKDGTASLIPESTEVSGTYPDSQVPAGSNSSPSVRGRPPHGKRTSKALEGNTPLRADSRTPLPPAPFGGAIASTPSSPGPAAARFFSSAPETADATLRIAAETPIAIRLTQDLSTKRNHKGEVFKGALTVPLTANGIVVAAAGAPVVGRIVDARSAKFFRGSSTLNLELTEIEAVNGRHLKIRTAQWYETGSHSRVVKAAILPSEAAKKVISGMKAEDDGPNQSERTMEPESPDNNDKPEKKRSAVTLNPGSEIVFRLLEPILVPGSLDSR